MHERITHDWIPDGTPQGVLRVSCEGVEGDLLTKLMTALLLTRTPNSRHNYLRDALRYVNARVADGTDPTRLFDEGPAGFREDLDRWRRNEAGRFAWVCAGGVVSVYLDGELDEDVTDGVNLTLKGHLLSGRRKYRGFLLSFINFELEEGEDPHAFITEPKMKVRHRVEEWIKCELALNINFLNGQPDSSVDVQSEDGAIDHRALGIAAVRQFYEVLRAAVRVRAGPNPLDIDGLDDMDIGLKRQLAYDKYGKYDRLPRHFGAQYAIKGRTDYAPIPHDPTVAYQVLRAAADECEGFPEPLKNLLDIMDGEGPRHHDMKNKCFDAWAASDFGEWMWADDKGLSDPDAKRVVLGPECIATMIRRVEDAHAADPDRPSTIAEIALTVMSGGTVRPSMAQLRELKATGRMDVLAKIPMLPSSTGRPYSYGGWNYWIRKATDNANGGEGAFINTSIGRVRPTVVWLRRSMFTERVVDLSSKTTEPKALKAGLTVIRKDAGHRSDGSIYRYAHSVLPGIFAEGQVRRSAEARERLAAVRAGRPVPVSATDEARLSDASEARRGRARP